MDHLPETAARPFARTPEAVPVGRSPLIGVVGATGGCGVTTIAVHLARSHRSCVVECGSRAGLAERVALDRDRLVAWGADDSLDGLDLAALPMPGGFRAVFARGETPEGVEGVAAAMAGRFDSVVLDVPFGHDPPVVCDVVVVVMPASVPGALRARPLVAQLESAAYAVIANRLGAGGEVTRTELQRTVRRRIALELPACAALRDAEDEGRLIAPGRSWSRRLDRVARAVRGAGPRSRPSGA